MDLARIIRELRKERENLDAVLASLGCLPKAAETKKNVPKKRRRRKLLDDKPAGNG